MCSSGKKPKTIGILGAGQLGLMLSHALSALGAEVLILEPQKNAPAAVQTPFVTEAPFDDVVALQSFFERCDRVTYEFEHIPTAALREVLQKPEYA
jgi:5-(carboxyamino)imidazole ribonucleotide synthase